MNRLAWFSAGLGVGLAATVLAAPEAGAETRRRIRGMSHRAGNLLRGNSSTLEDAVQEAGDKIVAAADQAADTARDLTHKAGEKLEEGGEQLQNA